MAVRDSRKVYEYPQVLHSVDTTNVRKMDSATGRDVYPDVEPNHNNGFNQSAPNNQYTVLPQPTRKEFRYAMVSGTWARRIKAAMQTITREKPLMSQTVTKTPMLRRSADQFNTERFNHELF